MTGSREAHLEEEFILALVLAREEQAAELAAKVDWKRVGALAARELIGGYLHRRVERSRVAELVPAELRERLAAANRKIGIDNLLLLARMKELARALGEAGVPFILLKGGALLADVYPDPGTRSLADIDFLVDREHVREACARMERLGWKRKEDFQVAARRCGFETRPPGICHFEVHWDLSQRYRFQADLARIWREARPFEIDGIAAARLGNTDEFVYLCLHYAAHYFGLTVKWLIDLVELLRQRDLDFRAIGDRARSWHAASALHVSLLYLHRSAPELLPRTAVDRAGRRPLLDRLIQPYINTDPFRFLGSLPKGPRRLLLAALFQDRMRDRIALAWLTQVRGHREED